MKRPSPSDLEAWIVDAGFTPGELPVQTVMLIRDVLRPVFFSSWVAVKDPDGDWHMWQCRTVPTARELTRAKRNRKGTAIIAPGRLNVDCWGPGYHSPGKYGQARPCLRQVAPIVVHRDDDGDTSPEWSQVSTAHMDARGVNLHDFRGSSAGCPVLPKQAHVDQILAVCSQHPEGPFSMLLIEPLFESLP